MPDKTFTFKRDKNIGGQFSKYQVLLERHTDGTEQIKIFVVGKYNETTTTFNKMNSFFS